MRKCTNVYFMKLYLFSQIPNYVKGFSLKINRAIFKIIVYYAYNNHYNCSLCTSCNKRHTINLIRVENNSKKYQMCRMQTFNIYPSK